MATVSEKREIDQSCNNWKSTIIGRAGNSRAGQINEISVFLRGKGEQGEENAIANIGKRHRLHEHARGKRKGDVTSGAGKAEKNQVGRKQGSGGGGCTQTVI